MNYFTILALLNTTLTHPSIKQVSVKKTLPKKPYLLRSCNQPACASVNINIKNMPSGKPSGRIGIN